MSHAVTDIIQYLSSSIVNVLLFFHCSLFVFGPFNQYFLFRLVIMSEEKSHDENGAATEQNPMVQRISLEVQRREPSSVSSLLIFSSIFHFY